MHAPGPNQPLSQLACRLTGRVQGVGFRWWAVRTAQRLGLRGTVRNCPDGSVEVVAAGEPAAVRRFRELLADGPPGARVDRVRSVPLPGSLPPDFRVVH